MLILFQVFYFDETEPRIQLVTFFVLVTQFYPLALALVVMLVLFVVAKCCCPNPDANAPVPNAQHVLKRLTSHVMRTDSPEECPICKEEYKTGDHIRPLPCKHEFHKVCVDKWLTTAGQTCPLCRANVVQGVENQV